MSALFLFYRRTGIGCSVPSLPMGERRLVV